MMAVAVLPLGGSAAPVPVNPILIVVCRTEPIGNRCVCHPASSRMREVIGERLCAELRRLPGP